jgi:hypothetical protein
MNKRVPYFALWVLMAGMFAAPSAQAWGGAGDSLYDSSKAIFLSGNPFINFGPKSSKFRYDPRMIRAAEIAAERAHPHSTRECWRSVKTALVEAQVVDSRPLSEFAKEAGVELHVRYGFKEIYIQNPFDAPVGAVLVYGGRGAGHVELRTPRGFVSDFESPVPSSRPLLGVYLKPS